MSPQNTDNTESDDVASDLECGHVEQAREYGQVPMPGIGSICRVCYGLNQLERWPETLRRKTVHHRTGETSHPQTLLIGIDDRNRLVYLDEFNRELIRVIPKHHPDFRSEEPLTDYILRHYPPAHGPSRPDPVNAPDGDVIAVVEKTDIDASFWSHQNLLKWIVEQGPEEFIALTGFTIDNLRRSTLDGTSAFAKHFTESE